MASNPRRTDSWVWVLLVVLVLAMVIPGVLFMGSWAGGGMMGGTGFWGWGLPAMLVGIVIVVVLVALLARGVESVPAPAYPYPGVPMVPAPVPAIQILDARYARGELSRDEYLRMRQDLESRHP